jgi:adenylate cyclase
LLGDYARALASLRECALRAPNFLACRVWLAAAHAQLGQLDEARVHVGEILRINPNYSMAGSVVSRLFRRPEDVEHLFAGLRKAGLRES